MRRFTIVGVITLLALCHTAFAEEAKIPQLGQVFGQARSPKEDVIYFRNKDVLRGRVMNETVSIATQYGTLKIPMRFCAGLSFEGARANTEAVVTVNFNRITGIITDRVINFRIGSSGAKIPIRKEKVRFLLLQKTANEADFLQKTPKADLFLMANGDLLSGEAVERKVIIATDYAKVPVAFAEMVDVKMQGGDNITAVISKKNKDTLRGTLDTDELTLDLEIGVQVQTVYKDKFARFFVDRARTEAPKQFGVQQPIHGESDGVQPPLLDGGKSVSLKLADGIEMKFVRIPAGKFKMGSPVGEKGRDDDEGPQKTVTISRRFYMGITEVTQAQYNAVMGTNPSKFKQWSHPVEHVSWEDASAFCKKLSQKASRRITLPTEAEWEYACRAGSTTLYSFGDDERSLARHAWYSSNSDTRTHPVGKKTPNAWGLYDMHGNVWEWCQDWYAGSYANPTERDPQGPKSGNGRLLRGGGWHNDATNCRSARRFNTSPSYRYNRLGFRVVLRGGVD